MKHIVVLLFLSFSSIFGQPEKIYGVLDDYSLLLKNGEKVKLAGIRFPNIHHPDTLIGKFAKNVSDSMKHHLVGKYFRIEVDSESRRFGKTNSVHLYKRINAEKLENVNSRFLEKGFGLLEKNIDEEHLPLYNLSHNSAKIERKGYWKLILDRDYNKLIFLTENEISNLKLKIEEQKAESVSKLKIERIIDANLFELNNGVQIKMAGIDVPSIADDNDALRSVAKKAVSYAKIVLRNFSIEADLISSAQDKYPGTYLIKNFPLNKKDYQVEYIKRGFARINSDLDTALVKDYKEAEQEAFKDAIGIWSVKGINYLKNLDDDYSEEDILVRETPGEFQSDVILTKPKFLVVNELLSGAVGGALGGIAGGLIGVGIAKAGNERGGFSELAHVVLGGSAGIIIGEALGVYVTAKKYNPNVNFGETLVFSVAGGLATIGLGHSLDSEEFAYVGLILPAVGAIFYTEVIAEQPTENLNIGLKRDKFEKFNLTHQDIYNSSKLFEMNVLRIKF
ncbi:MAG: thermonuclease family protein [Melioribacteraceae bacterium]|nr:thermonuclease family protein [Melioribacteraceae bacterium]